MMDERMDGPTRIRNATSQRSLRVPSIGLSRQPTQVEQWVEDRELS